MTVRLTIEFPDEGALGKFVTTLNKIEPPSTTWTWTPCTMGESWFTGRTYMLRRDSS